VLFNLFVVEPVPVFCLDLDGERRLKNEPVGDAGILVLLLAEVNADAFAQIFADQSAHHFGEELRVLFIKHFQEQEAIVRGAILALGVAGEETDGRAHVFRPLQI